MKYVFALIAFSILLFSSCNKDEMETNEGYVSPPSYMPLTIGSYWVYDIYRIDSLGNEVKLQRVDSLTIKGDTLINNQFYFVYGGANYPFPYYEYYLRDSLGYLVDNSGHIHFSTTNFTDTLYSNWEIKPNGDTLNHRFSMMGTTEKNINVPAGSFTTLDYRSTFENFDLPLTDPERIIVNHVYKSEGIGTVLSALVFLETNSVPSYVYYEKRLIRYHIQE
jgi:hypothetical protein